MSVIFDTLLNNFDPHRSSEMYQLQNSYVLTPLNSTSQVEHHSFIFNVFESLNQSGIRYCHWKSNSHLDLSFQSDCDFDLLIAQADAAKFSKILAHYNFKRKFFSANYVFPGFEDYLGFDESSGKIYHFHVHYKLITGKKFEKNYRFPIEELVLDTSILHPTFPIKVILPELELIFLMVRSLLKFSLDRRTIKRILLHRKKFPPNILNELDYLGNAIDTVKFQELGNNMFAELSWLFREFSSVYPANKSIPWLIVNRHRLLKSLKSLQIYKGRRLNIQRKIRILASKYNLAWLGKGGISIGFVGVDGAGKSTAVAEVSRWLHDSLSVKTFYMGLPKRNLIWELLRLFYRIFKKLGFNFLTNTFNVLKNLYSARIKYKTSMIAEMAKNQGNIVLFDRYPLGEIDGLDEPIDGPIIEKNTFWEKKEKKYYRKMQPVDYLFVLLPNPEDAIRRKSEHEENHKQNQIKKINQTLINFVTSNSTANFLIPVNTSRSRENVLLDIKKHTWRILN